MRKFTEDSLLIASHNKGKIAEIEKLLSPYVKKFSTALEHNLSEPEENGKTFHENARIKALMATAAVKLPALADDSGICLEALNGAPGIYSARWTGQDKNYQAAIDRIFRELGAQPAVTDFVTVFALAWPDGEVVYAEGRARGKLLLAPRGENGFGYDIYFVPDGCDQTFAELGAAVKDNISARARAFRSLVKTCFQ